MIESTNSSLWQRGCAVLGTSHKRKLQYALLQNDFFMNSIFGMRNLLDPLPPLKCMIPFHPLPTNAMPADSATKAGRSKETTADESMVQDLPHHVGCGIRLFLPVRHLSSYVLAYPFGKALCPMAPRGKLEDSVAKPNITEIRIPRDPKASCATTRRLLRYDVTFGDVKASQGRVKMGDCRWQAKLGSSQVRSRVTLIKQLPAMCSDPAPRSSSQRRRSYRTQWLLQAPLSRI
jgi:hypothetical protein